MSNLKTSNGNLLITIVILVLLAASCTVTEKPQFVQVRGIQFILNGEPYSFVGTNFWYGAYLGMPGEKGDRKRLKKELDYLLKNGITNLRILGSSEQSDLENSVTPAFIDSNGNYNEDLLIGLDYLLVEMDKRNMKAVIFLNNFWEWSGGMSTWNEWYGVGPAIDPAKTGNWVGFMHFSAKFYVNKAANRKFRDYIESLVTRTNTITGKPYTEDPAIMAWQLANEPRPGQGRKSIPEIPHFIEWIYATSSYIKSLDSNHLVSSGNEGEMGSLDSMKVFIDAHDTPNIDYLTFHMWAKNWGWYLAEKPDSTFPITKNNAAEYIYDHVKAAEQLNKPIVLEEFGLGRDYERFERRSPVRYRDEYYNLVFSLVEQYEALAGTNFWTWGGFGEAQHNDFWWRPGDPFTGDPPQEPQGLNSVFADDSSTINLIRKHAENLAAMSK